MSKKQFKVIIEQDEDGYFVANVPMLPGCVTQARNINELKERVRDAIALCLEMAQHDRAYRKRMKSFSYEPAFVGLELINV